MGVLIESIRIKNFRALKDIEVRLKPITILVGANNSGKTTLLRALNSILGITRNSINQDDLFVDKNGNQVSKEITIDIKIIPIDEQGNKIANFDPKWNGKLGFVGVQFDNDNEYIAFRAVYSFGIEDSPKMSAWAIVNWENEQLHTEELKGFNQLRNNIKMYFIDAQRDILEDSQQRTSFFGKLVSNLDYGTDLEDLKQEIETINQKAIDKSAVLKHLKDALKKLNQTTQTKSEGVSLNPFPKKISDLHKGMKVYFQDSESDAFSMENHGMGTRSWASIITAGAFSAWQLQQIDEKIDKGEETDLLFPIFALEEPEAHLHPNAQRTLYKQLKAFKGQKIISTHSPYIAGQAELEELRHFYKNGEASLVSEVNFSVLDEKEIARIKDVVQESNGEVLFSNVVVMSEGKTESILLPMFANAFFEKTTFELGINFIATGKHYPLLTLMRFLQVKWFIFSDYDKPDVKSALEDVLRKNNVSDQSNVIKLNDNKSQNDIESYLYDSGYAQELKESLKSLKTPIYQNEQHKRAKESELAKVYAEIDSFSKEDVIREIGNWKVKAAPIYAKLILEREGIDRVPPKIRELFDKIAQQLNLKPKEDAESHII